MLIIINIIVYISEFIILCIIFFVKSNSYDIYREVQAHFLNILYILSIAAFILYSYSLYRNWKNRPIHKNSKSFKRMRFTFIIAIVISVTFFIRVIVNALWTRFIVNWKHRYPFEAAFYAIIEFMPITLLLVLILKFGFRQTDKNNFTKMKQPSVLRFITSDEEEGLLDYKM